MSLEGRPAKRQRSSLSPSSPPYHLGKLEEPVRRSLQPPRTPQSPLRMSSEQHASSGTDGQTIPTPPHTAGLSSHATDTTGLAASQDTPVSMALSRDGDRDVRTGGQDDTVMTDAADHRRTDHERQEEMEASEEREPIGPLPLLCQTSHSQSTPHASQNLISIYSLNSIAASVARKDPVTGEKINKLRKSYEGKVKTLALPGRNKPTDRPGELLGLMEWPDEGWYDQRVYGRELETALDPSKGIVMGKLDKALKMLPGRLPNEEHERWKNIVGLEDASATPAATTASGPGLGRTASTTDLPIKSAAHSVMQRSQPTSMRNSAPSSPRAGVGAGAGAGGLLRPERSGKKRRYDDSSFEGYADGYQDDDGYDTEGRSLSGRKRRRDFPNTSPPSAERFDGPSSSHFASSSASSGMVGVRSS